MLKRVKNILKKLTPEKLLIFYHRLNAYVASFLYGYPSKSMIVVGITGTKGKTSSGEFIWSVLSHGGYKTGLLGTAHVRIGSDQVLENKIHMTMPSPWLTQKLLSQMKKAGCTHAVLEVSSEGLKQCRHIGIAYDIAVFTNLSPEHLPSHNNSFDEYKKAKGVLFRYTPTTFRKKLFDNKKVAIINKDTEWSKYFYTIPTDEHIYFSLADYKEKGLVNVATNTIIIDGVPCTVNIPGEFNLSNALIGYAVGRICRLPIEKIKQGIETVKSIPGRMEELTLGQSFRVFIDYAHEKLSMENLLKAAHTLKGETSKIIILFGAEGGGRDKRKRKDMAELTDKQADYVILSNVDPYEEDPSQIIRDIAGYFTHKKENEDLFLIEDRRVGINKALSLARPGDLVLICGKGSEQTMEVNGSVIPWDERSIVKKELEKYIEKKV